MDSRLYGFLLEDDVIFNIGTRNLIYYCNETSEHPLFLKVVSLNETQSRLFVFLLTHRNNSVIDKDKIMKYVWDEFDLPSSNQRLWKTINDLKKKLSSIGLPDDFIANVHGMGYSISNSKIGTLHIQ